MSKKFLFFGSIGVILFSLNVISLAPANLADAAVKGKAQKECPVLGGEIDKKNFIDYKGYRIYFCCSGCDQEFKKNPEKYLKKMKEDGVQLEKSPKK